MDNFKYSPPNSPIEIVYQDEYFIVINKPSGLLSVPGRLDDRKDCVLSRLEGEFGSLYAVHRLDMDTSGLMVIARDKPTHAALSQQFQNRKVIKIYQALVWGKLLHINGQIERPLICDWPNRPRQIVCYVNGKYALTHYQVIHSAVQNNHEVSYLALYPHTGRTHQLRVHMQDIDHPILGCDLYAHPQAKKASPRLCLHASNLAITHPITQHPMSWQLMADFWF